MASRPLLVLLGALAALSRSSEAARKEAGTRSVVLNGPIRVFRDASGKLVEVPEEAPAQVFTRQQPEGQPAAAVELARQLDALYDGDAAVRTRHVRPLTRKALRATLSWRHGGQAASVGPTGKQRRVVSFNGV